MTIRVRCINGHLLSAPSNQAGKKGECPKCGKPVTIPSAGETSTRGETLRRASTIKKAPPPSPSQPTAPKLVPAAGELKKYLVKPPSGRMLERIQRARAECRSLRSRDEGPIKMSMAWSAFVISLWIAFGLVAMIALGVVIVLLVKNADSHPDVARTLGAFIIDLIWGLTIPVFIILLLIPAICLVWVFSRLAGRISPNDLFQFLVAEKNLVLRRKPLPILRNIVVPTLRNQIPTCRLGDIVRKHFTPPDIWFNLRFSAWDVEVKGCVATCHVLLEWKHGLKDKTQDAGIVALYAVASQRKHWYLVLPGRDEIETWVTIFDTPKPENPPDDTRQN